MAKLNEGLPLLYRQTGDMDGSSELYEQGKPIVGCASRTMNTNS
jgi:hypothetical protein